MDPALLLAPGAAVLGWQAWRLRREARARAAARAGFLDPCRPLFEGAEVRPEPHGFPRLRGAHGGAFFDLRVVPDALAVRKLPALWLLATLAGPQPVAATCHLMLRPRGAETFSRFHLLPVALPALPGVPEDHGLRSDGDAPAPAALALPVARLGSDGLKEVVASPRGLRVTALMEEADRGRFLLFRDAEMGREPLDPARLRPILAALLALRDALGEEG